MDERARNMNVPARSGRSRPRTRNRESLAPSPRSPPPPDVLSATFCNALHAPHTFRLLHASHFENRLASPAWAQAIRHASWLLELYDAGEIEVRVPPIGRRTMRPRVGLLLPPMTPYHERRAGPNESAARSSFILFE